MGRRRMAERPNTDRDAAPDEGNMSVREAGRKGGRTTRARYGAEFFQEIGAKGGRRVAELIARAKRLDAQDHE